jgi:endonuclease/exonuclease/phosphatase family metal-dependent hydrolase
MKRYLDSLWTQAHVWAVPCLTTMFGLQFIRLLVANLTGYVRDAQGVDAINLAPVALGIFATAFLAGLLRRVAGGRGAVLITAGVVAVIRLVEQFSVSPPLDLTLSAAGTILFLLFLPNGLGNARGASSGGTLRFGIGVMLGAALDTAIHIGACTLDLSWHPGVLPIVLVLLLAGCLLAALRSYATSTEREPGGATGWTGALPLIALGPWILLQLLVFQNVARVSALTGWETPAAGALVLNNTAIGLAAAIWYVRRRLPTLATAVAGLLFLGTLIVTEPTGIAAGLLMLAGQVLSSVLAVTIFAATDDTPGQPRLARTSIAWGLAQILFVLLVFLYYVAYDIELGFRAQVLLPVAACLVGMGAVAAARRPLAPTPDGSSYWPALATAVLTLVPLALSLTWDHPGFITPNPGNTRVRVIDYNLHNGFNAEGRLDLEALARVIEDSGADVVGLQEVSRGWLIWGGADMLTWLSQRLDMPYVTGPTSDAQWGNAVLSRYPIVSSETHPLPPESLLIRRGYIKVEIDIGGGTLTLFDTHFDHRGSTDEPREMQAAVLVDAWNSSPATIMVGDMNAEPDTTAMLTLSGAGLSNVAGEICTPPVLTSSADNPHHQIDYIWVSPDLEYSDCQVIQTTASDHFPVVATIHLP